MNIDILATYFPEVSSIPTEELATARAQVVNYLQPAFPDEDLSPGSVVGDSVVSILAVWVAGRKISLDRFTSDLDPAQVARGVIYSCDFVERYLDNFGVYDSPNLNGSGVVRLTFSTDQTYTINRSVKFRFGTTDIFTLRLVAADDLTIQSSDSTVSSDPDVLRLSPTSATTWAVDVPITGVMTTDVAASTSGEISVSIGELVGIVTVGKMVNGTPPSSLSELAQLTRMAAHASTPSNRQGTISMIHRNWPETQAVSVVVTGDPEMLRSTAATAVSLSAPAMDIYFQSAKSMTRVQQVVRIPFNAAVQKFRGKLNLIHPPVAIFSLRWTGDISLPIPDIDVISRHLDAIGSLGVGTTGEEIWVDITSPVVDSLLLIGRESDADGLYALFEIDYYTDPLFTNVSDTLTSAEYAPVGVSVAVSMGPVAILSSVEIQYVRDAGVTLNRAAAREEVGNYIRSAGNGNPVSLGDIGEIMHAAGARRLRSVIPTGTIRLGAATLRFPGVFDPTADVDWGSNEWALQSWNVTDMDSLAINEVFSGDAGGYDDAWAVTDKNLRFYVADDNIIFTELT